MTMNRRILLPFVFAAMTITPAVMAQDANPPAGGGTDRNQRDRGNRGGNNGGDWQERITNFMKERLGNPSEDEWKVIEPKLRKVLEMRRDTMGGRGMFGGGRPGDRGRDSNSDNEQKPSVVQQASTDLQKTLDNK